MLLRLLLAATLLLALPVWGHSPSWLDSNVSVVQNTIIPGYKAVFQSATKLEAEIDKQCQRNILRPVSNKEKALFKRLMVNWAKVQYVRFGPIEFLERYQRLYYWPDKHSVGQRQLRRLLSDMAAQDISTFDISKKSAAIQGLPALERLLFTDTKQPRTQSQCQLMSVIADNVRGISERVYQGWALPPVQFDEEIAKAEQGNGFYDSSEQIAALLINSLHNQLQLIEREKLGRALNIESPALRAKKLEAWRSRSSKAMLLADVQALFKLYQRGFAPAVKHKNSELDANVRAAFKQIQRSIKAVKPTFNQAILTDEGIKQLQALKAQIAKLDKLIVSSVMAELNLRVQFNALDGD